MQDQSLPAPTFGAQLRGFRERAGLSQAELAKRSDLGVSTISALERGVNIRPYPHTLRRLADALGLTAAEQAAFLRSVQHSSVPSGRGVEASSVQQLEPSIRLAPPSALIGRSDDLASLRTLIEPPVAVRLLTVTGMGGIGKTRLALELMAEIGDAFPDGVWLVDLAPVDEPDRVPHVVAEALGVRDVPDTPLVDRLIVYLGSRRALLVLDNCEHLQDACAMVIDRLLEDCSNLQVVATSREPLDIPGEQVWRLDPLAIPSLGPDVTLALLEPVAAVRLFVERAQAVNRHFALTDENAVAVASVCIQLEGIPLALELAAAHTRVLTVDQIVARLTDTLVILAGRSRMAPIRHHSVRAALDWSYDLLAEPEQVLFQRLAVFRGGCDLDAVEAVCADSVLPTAALLDLITQLVDQSLVQVEDGGLVARYRLLEPVRQYAEERLLAAGEQEIVAARHAAAYGALAEHAARQLGGPAQIQWFDRLSHDHENVRAALRWAAQHGEAELGLRLAIALAPFWAARGHLGEGRGWLAAMLALENAEQVSASRRVQALVNAGELAQWQAELVDADESLEAGLALAREIGDRSIEAEALAWLGAVKRRQGDFAGSISMLEDSLALGYELESQPARALGLLNLGVTVANAGDVVRGQELLEAALSQYRALGDVRYIAIASTMLGEAAAWFDDRGRAATLFSEGLAGHLTVGDRAFIEMGLRHVAQLVEATQPAAAARLLGAAEALRETLIVRDHHVRPIVRIHLSAEELEAAFTAGRALTIEQATAEALALMETVSREAAEAP